MREELGVEGAEITLMGKIQMEYGPNDFEISQIYTGVVKPEQVHFDPEEIAGIRFKSLDEIDAEMSAAPETYCIWFIELMNWYRGRAAGLIELENFIKR
jgi:isopentenyldiphosphate isomerase